MRYENDRDNLNRYNSPQDHRINSPYNTYYAS